MTIDRKVQATEMSCPEVRKRVKNQILSQMMTRIAKMYLVIADLDQQSTFVPDDQIAEVTVQAHTMKRKKRKTKRKQTKKRTKTKTKKVRQSYKG